MSSEEYHACALREEGTVLCWGSKLDGHQASPGEGYRFTSSAAAALTGALCATMARSCVGDGHKRGSRSHSGWTMTSTTVFRLTAYEHRNLLCRCPQHRVPGERRH